MNDSDYGRVSIDVGATGLLVPDDAREIVSHKVNGLNEALQIFALDAAGPGGANHEYVVKIPLSSTLTANTLIKFQKGPIGEAGVNGLSNEALLAIVEDRLRGFQAGPFACRENGMALSKIEEAADFLRQRTTARVNRGVEGTMQV